MIATYLKFPNVIYLTFGDRCVFPIVDFKKTSKKLLS
jgi:hypothetical protein